MRLSSRSQLPTSNLATRSRWGALSGIAAFVWLGATGLLNAADDDTASAGAISGSPAASRHLPWHPEDLVAVLGDERGRMWSSGGDLLLTPDGRRLIASVGSSSLLIYDADTLDVLTAFGGRPARLLSAALSQDGSRLMAGYADGALTLWNIAGERPEPEQTVNVMPADTEPRFVHYAHALRSDRVAVTVGNSLMLWELLAGRLQQLLAKDLADQNATAVISPDGRQVAMQVAIMKYGDDVRLSLCNVDHGELVEIAQCITPRIKTVLFTPDGRNLIGGPPPYRAASVMRRFKIDGNQLIEQPILSLRADVFRPPSFSDDGHLMAIFDERGRLAMADISKEPWHRVAKLGVQWDWLSGTLIPGNGESLYVLAQSCLQRWDRSETGDYAPVRPEPVHSYFVSDVLFSADGNSLTSVGGHTLCEWDLRRVTNPEPRVHDLNLGVWEHHHLAAWPERNCVVFHNRDANGECRIRFWDAAHSTVSDVNSIDFGANSENDAWCFAVCPGGKLLATGHWDQSIRFWSLAGAVPMQVGKLTMAHSGHVCAVAFSPDGRLLASVGFDHAVKLWDVSTAPPSDGRELGQHEGIVRSVAFSPDDRWLASGDEKGVIRFWNLTSSDLSGLTIRHPEDVAHPAPHFDEYKTVNTLEFSGDGRRLLSADGGGRVTVWTVPTGEIVKRWTFPGCVFAARWSPDQQLIATANQNGTVYLLVAPQP